MHKLGYTDMVPEQNEVDEVDDNNFSLLKFDYFLHNEFLIC